MSELALRALVEGVLNPPDAMLDAIARIVLAIQAQCPGDHSTFLLLLNQRRDLAHLCTRLTAELADREWSLPFAQAKSDE